MKSDWGRGSGIAIGLWLLCLFYPAYGAESSPLVINGESLPSVTFTQTSVVLSSEECHIANGSAIGDATFTLLQVQCPSVIISDVALIGGSTESFGGCLLFQSVSVISISNSYFHYCKTRLGGGGIAIFPYDSLQLSIRNTAFLNVRAEFEGSVTKTERIVAGGSAVFVSFKGTTGNNSSFHLDGVVVDTFQHLANSSSTFSSYPAVVGGSIVVEWPEIDSGHDVSIVVTNTSFTRGWTNVMLPITCQESFSCSISSLFFLFFWANGDSGHRARLIMSDVYLHQSTFSGGMPKAIGAGFYWHGERSGTMVSFETEGFIIMDSCQMASDAMALGLWWNGVASGNFSKADVRNSTMEASDSKFDPSSRFFWMSWPKADSGNHVTVSSSGSTWTASNCIFDTSSSFFLMSWYGGDSGNHLTMSSTGSTWSALNSSFGSSSSFFFMYWESVASGNSASVSSSSSTWLGSNCVFDSASLFFWIYWQGTASGNNVSLCSSKSTWTTFESIFSESQFVWLYWQGTDSGNHVSLSSSFSSWIVSHSVLDTTPFFWMNWDSDYAGNNVSLYSSDSMWAASTSRFGSSSKFFWMSWLGVDSGNGLSFCVSDSTWTASNSSFPLSSSFFWMSWWNRGSGNHMFSLLSGSTLSISNTSFFDSPFFWLSWWDAGSGNNMSLSSSSSTWTALNSVSQSSFLWFFWRRHSSGSNAIIQFSNYICSFAVESYGQSPNNTEKGEVASCKQPSFAFSNSHFTSIIAFYSFESFLETTMVLDGVYSNSSVIDSVVEVFPAGLCNSILFLQSVNLQNSIATGLQVILIQEQGEESFDVSPFSANLTVDGVFVEKEIKGSWSSVVLQGADYSHAGNLTVTIRNLRCSKCGEIQLLSLKALSSSLNLMATLCSVSLKDALLASFVVEGVSGTVELRDLDCQQCILTETASPLFSFSAFTNYDERKLRVLLSNVTFYQLSVGKPSVGLFEAVGQVGVVIGSEPVHFLIDWYNSSAPLWQLKQGIGLPQFAREKEGQLYVQVTRRYSLLRETMTLFEYPKGWIKENANTFLYNVSLSHKNGAMRARYDFSSANDLQCPMGYDFQYNVTVGTGFYKEYVLHPYSCLDPFRGELKSCDRPFLSAFSTCTPCPTGTISFFQGGASSATTVIGNSSSFFTMATSSLVRCLPCPNALVCQENGGPADATVVAGYWSLPLPLLWNISNIETPLSALFVACPSGACVPSTALTYINGYVVDGTSLCTAGRNPQSPLCATCLDYASAALFGDECVHDCQWSTLETILSVLMACLAIGYVVFLLIKPLSAQSPWIRIITYYYSVLQLLYKSEGSRTETIVVTVASALSTLSLPMVRTPHKSVPLCFPGAQPIDIYLARLFLPLCLVFLFTVAYALYGVCTRILRKKSVERHQQQQKLVSGLFSIVLLCYSSIAGAVFAFAPCVQVPTVVYTNVDNATVTLESRLLQHAEWACWRDNGAIGVVLFIGLLVVFAVPIGLFVWQGMFPSKGQSQRPFKRCRPRNWKGITVLSILEGNLRVWYWDVFLFARRAVLELVSVFAMEGLAQQLLFGSFNGLFLAVHAWKRPYMSSLANGVEAISLFLLWCIGMFNLPKTLIDAVPSSLTPELRAVLERFQNGQSWVAFAGFVFLMVTVASVYLYRLRSIFRRFRRRKNRFAATELEELPSTPTFV